MSAVHWEPVDVRLIDGKPARFVWRGRLYSVLAILDRWTAGSEGDEFWRVSASPGKNVPASSVELRHDVDRDSWTVSRTSA